MSQKTKKSFKTSRLQFTEEERADPTLEKPITKSEKAADKLEKAQSKLPKKIAKTKERTFDAETGKAKVRLHFEEVDKPKPPSKLEHNIKKAPQRAALSSVHKEVGKYEQDNVGLEAARDTEKQLYPSANITITGFEKTDLPDSFFDLAIGNVPFSNYLNQVIKILLI